MISLSVLICTCLAILVTAVWLQFAPWYSAFADIKVFVPKDPTSPVAAFVPEDTMKRMVATNAMMITSEKVLKGAIDTPRFQKTSWYRKVSNRDVVRELQKTIQVAPQQSSDMIRVSMTLACRTREERQDLAEVVNIVADQACKEAVDYASQGRREQARSCTTELDTVRNDLSLIRKRLVLAKPANMSAYQQQSNVLTYQLQQLNGQMQALGDQRAKLQARLDTLDKQDASQISEILQAMEQDPTAALKLAQVNIITDRDSLLQQNLGKDHYKIRSLDSKLEVIGKQIKDKEKELINTLAISYREGLKRDLAGIIESMLDVQGRIDGSNAQLKDIQNTIDQVQQLMVDEQSKLDRIKALEKMQSDLRLMETEVPISVRNLASEPPEPSFPRWLYMVPAGVVLGILLGLGLAFLLEFTDTSIKGPGDISRRVDLPLLGMVPHTDDLEEDVLDTRLAFQTHQRSLFGEAFRQIRTCLLFSGPASQRRSLLVTSSLAEDGRTTVAINLAAAIANGGRKVLVVDANLRQPAISKLFPQCNSEGLSNVLVGQKNWREQVHEVQPNMWLMASGPLPPNPAELLSSEQMRQMIAEMTAEYDQVIFDGAPCLVVTDGAVLGSMVDGVIIVVRAGANTYGIVQKTRDLLSRMGAHMVGVTLNGIRVTAGGYLRKNYDAFYEYNEPERSLPPIPKEVGKSETAKT